MTDLLHGFAALLRGAPRRDDATMVFRRFVAALARLKGGRG